MLASGYQGNSGNRPGWVGSTSPRCRCGLRGPICAIFVLRFGKQLPRQWRALAVGFSLTGMSKEPVFTAWRGGFGG